MKRFFLKILSFTFMFIFIYTTSVFFLIKYDLNKDIDNLPNPVTGGYGYSLERFKEADSLKGIDILFIGSSHSYRSFDPKLFSLNGLSSFNLGSSLQTPVNSYYLLKEYLPKMKPKLVIIESFWRVLQVDNYGTESSLDIVSNKPISTESLSMALQSKNILVFNAFVYQAVNRLFFPLENEQQKNIPFNSYKGSGYVQSTKKVSDKALKNVKPHSWTLKTHQLRYLEKCISLCTQYGSEVLLVMAPVTTEFYNSATNVTEVFKEINKFAEENDVSLLNYNNPDILQKFNSRSHFFDPNHLNFKGVKIFNKLLLEDLKTYDIIPLPNDLITSYDQNILVNGDFSKATSLMGWKIVGDESSLKLSKDGLNIKSSGKLTGVGQMVLSKGTNYELNITIKEIRHGSLSVYNYNKKLFSISKAGKYTFEFDAEYPSIYFYRGAKETDLTISNVSLINKIRK